MSTILLSSSEAIAINNRLDRLCNILQEKHKIPIPPDDCLGAHEAAQFLGISRGYLYVKVCRGEINGIRIGARIYFPKKYLEDIKNQNNGQ